MLTTQADAVDDADRRSLYADDRRSSASPSPEEDRRCRRAAKPTGPTPGRRDHPRRQAREPADRRRARLRRARGRAADPVRYPRDPTLDPQLVWKGKDELDGEDLVADAPPIYIQEKIDPRVLIENLRTHRRAAGGRARADAVRVLRRARRARPRRVLPARGQLVEPHDPRRLAQRHGEPRRARGAARQGPDDLHRPAVRDQVRLATGRSRPASATSRTASSRTPPARSSRSRRSATHGSSASTRYLTYLRDRLLVARTC